MYVLTINSETFKQPYYKLGKQSKLDKLLLCTPDCILAAICLSLHR